MISFPSHKCSITDKWQYNGMQVVWLENDLIKVGVLVGRGADIFEFRYKSQDVNFLLRLPGEIKNPRESFVQLRDTENQMEDYYYGGWQEVVPNSTPFNYRGARLGQHGEAWGIPWDYSIIRDEADKVSLKCWANPMRTPLLIEKILTLTKGSNELQVDLLISNQAQTSFDFMWGQHIAFGLPFLKDGAHIEINAKKMETEPDMPDHRRFKAGDETQWPNAVNIAGEKDDASYIPEENVTPYADLCYLSGFDELGRYEIVNEQKGIGFGLEWDASLYKYVWLWQERYATMDAPWWGRTYAVALEPWTSKPSGNPNAEIKKGNWFNLGPQCFKQTTLKAFPVDKNV